MKTLKVLDKAHRIIKMESAKIEKPIYELVSELIIKNLGEEKNGNEIPETIMGESS